MAGTEKLDQLPFMRITVVGGGGCGKTSLINAFVNRCMPMRHIKTEKQVVYHRKVLVPDEVLVYPIFVEIEDTPASERGPEDADLQQDQDQQVGPPRVKKGSRVIVDSSQEKVQALFKLEKYRSTRVQWKPGMKAQLGRECTVREKKKSGAVGLPSVDGSEGGIWLWPEEAVKLKVSLELPIDRYLNLRMYWRSEATSKKETEEEQKQLKTPFAAFKKKPDGSDPDRVDKTHTRNRMGFFIVFDLSDGSGNSLKEAMELYDLLQHAVHKAHGILAGKPIVFLIGTKADRTIEHEAIHLNDASAAAFSNQKLIQYHQVSARTMKKVNYVFEEMLRQIYLKEPLWAYNNTDELEDGVKDESICTVS